MRRNFGKCDLCVSDKFDRTKLQVFQKLGYNTIAINTVVDESVFEVKKKNKKGESRDVLDPIPPPPEIKLPQKINSDLRILYRLTVEFSEPSLSMRLNKSENLKKYDLLAVIPTSASAMNHACTNMDVDIISFNPESQTDAKINRKLYKQAVDRGIYFEVMYAPALKDSTHRKNIITRSHMYHTIGKSANILVTSGAYTVYQVRGPYDVVNLGLIFGLNDEQSKHSQTKNAEKVMLKADSRKRGKCAVFIVQPQDESLKILEGDVEETTPRKKMKNDSD